MYHWAHSDHFLDHKKQTTNKNEELYNGLKKKSVGTELLHFLVMTLTFLRSRLLCKIISKM